MFSILPLLSEQVIDDHIIVTVHISHRYTPKNVSMGWLDGESYECLESGTVAAELNGVYTDNLKYEDGSGYNHCSCEVATITAAVRWLQSLHL